MLTLALTIDGTEHEVRAKPLSYGGFRCDWPDGVAIQIGDEVGLRYGGSGPHPVAVESCGVGPAGAWLEVDSIRPAPTIRVGDAAGGYVD